VPFTELGPLGLALLDSCHLSAATCTTISLHLAI